MDIPWLILAKDAGRLFETKAWVLLRVRKAAVAIVPNFIVYFCMAVG